MTDKAIVLYLEDSAFDALIQRHIGHIIAKMKDVYSQQIIHGNHDVLSRAVCDVLRMPHLRLSRRQRKFVIGHPAMHTAMYGLRWTNRNEASTRDLSSSTFKWPYIVSDKEE